MIMKERKIKEFKFGQLMTINGVIYRCQKAELGEECLGCAVREDFYGGIVPASRYEKTCLRCQEFCKNFKRVSNGKPGR